MCPGEDTDRNGIITVCPPVGAKDHISAVVITHTHGYILTHPPTLVKEKPVHLRTGIPTLFSVKYRKIHNGLKEISVNGNGKLRVHSLT